MAKILLVDDDPVVIKMLDARLKANAFETLTALEATTGLEMAMKMSPDLIILDVMMPIINGFNFCRLLKSQECHKHIPIIMLTSRSEEEDKKIGEEVGANAYMVKPYDIDELIQKIKELLHI